MSALSSQTAWVGWGYLWAHLTAKRKSSVFSGSRFHGELNMWFLRFSAKAVANGALAFYLNNNVLSRIARMSVGTLIHWTFNQNDAEHLRRLDNKIITPSGHVVIKGGFRTVLKRVSTVILLRRTCSEHMLFRAPQSRERRNFVRATRSR